MKDRHSGGSRNPDTASRLDPGLRRGEGRESRVSGREAPAVVEWRGERFVPIGRFAGSHGVHGEARLRPFNPVSRVLEKVTEVVLLGAEPQRRPLLGARLHRDVWLVRIDGVVSREDALRLSGTDVAVPEGALAPLGDGEFFHYQLVGLEVCHEAGDALGTVTRVDTEGGNDLLVLATERGEVLIPLVEEFVRAIDLDRKRITVRLPDGLLDL